MSAEVDVDRIGVAMTSDLDARLTRLRIFCAATLPANYQSIQADIEALLRAYDRVRPPAGQETLTCR